MLKALKNRDGSHSLIGDTREPIVIKGKKLLNSYFAITPATRQYVRSTTPQIITGLSVTLKPESKKSKFLIMAVVSGAHVYVCSTLIYRNGQRVLSHGGNSSYPGANVTHYFTNSSGTNYMWSRHVHYMDSPESSEDITYDIRHLARWGSTGYTTYVNDRANNDMRTRSTMTVLEFAE